MTDSAEPSNASAGRSGRGWLAAAGLVLVAGGLLSMLHPFATSLATALVLGGSMIAGGAFAVAAGIADRGSAQRWLYLLLGFGAFVLGIVVLLYPFVAAVSLVWTIGAWLIAAGILQIGAGVRRRGRWWLVLLGAVDALLGGLLLIMDPISAIFFLAIAVGLTFAFHGAAMLALALRPRRT